MNASGKLIYYIYSFQLIYLLCFGQNEWRERREPRDRSQWGLEDGILTSFVPVT